MYLNYNLESANPTAQEIGPRDSTALRRAIGVLGVNDSEQLHFKTFRVTIGVQVNKATNEPWQRHQALPFRREGRMTRAPFEIDLPAVVQALAAATPLPLVWAQDVPKIWHKARELATQPNWQRMLTEDGPHELLAEAFSEGDADAIVELLKAMRKDV